jgi:hypothetical protein
MKKLTSKSLLLLCTICLSIDKPVLARDGAIPARNYFVCFLQQGERECKEPSQEKESKDKEGRTEKGNQERPTREPRQGRGEGTSRGPQKDPPPPPPEKNRKG